MSITFPVAWKCSDFELQVLLIPFAWPARLSKINVPLPLPRISTDQKRCSDGPCLNHQQAQTPWILQTLTYGMMSYHCRLIHSSSRWKWELRLMILMQAFSTNSRPVRQLRLLAALGCTCPLRSQSSSRALWISTRCVSYFLSEFWGSDDHHAILKHCCFSSRVSRQTRLPVLGWEEKFVNLCAGHFECSTFLAAIQQQQHQPPPAQELSRILLIQIDGFFCSFSSTTTSLCTYPCLITWPDRVEEKHEGYKDNYHCIGARIVRKNEDLDVP